MIDAQPRWILGDLDLTWGGLAVESGSFDPGEFASILDDALSS